MLSPHPPHRVEHPLMFQTWVHLTFLHWSYPPAVLQPLLPPGLELDTFRGRGWVGLVPFYIHSLRAPLLPSLPYVGSFPETNLRTYVRGPDGEPGVWFFSLDAARFAAVAAARFAYGLPYVWSRMRIERKGRRLVYASRRIASEGSCRVAVRPGEPIPLKRQTALDLFLTARFRLFTILFGRLAYAQVEHEAYPLARATLHELSQSLTAAAGLPEPKGEALVHYARRVEVRVGAPHLCLPPLPGAAAA